MDSALPISQMGKTIEDAINGAELPASFIDLIRIPLCQPGKVLSGTPDARWPAYVFAGCIGTGGESSAAIRVAAAVELFMAGLDVLDEIEDGDYSPLVAEAGQAQALNVSTALTFLAQRVLGGLNRDGVPVSRLPLFHQTMADAGLAATGGQYLDLASVDSPDFTMDDGLEVARRKGGSLVAGACRLGAMLGTDQNEILDLYSAWGRHYGTMAQLANDLHDAEDVQQKSDIKLGKPTLPLLFSRNSALTTESPSDLTPESIAASGALHFTWVVIEVERENCRRLTEEMAANGQDVRRLVQLLS